MYEGRLTRTISRSSMLFPYTSTPETFGVQGVDARYDTLLIAISDVLHPPSRRRGTRIYPDSARPCAPCRLLKDPEQPRSPHGRQFRKRGEEALHAVVVLRFPSAINALRRDPQRIGSRSRPSGAAEKSSGSSTVCSNEWQNSPPFRWRPERLIDQSTDIVRLTLTQQGDRPRVSRTISGVP